MTIQTPGLRSASTDADTPAGVTPVTPAAPGLEGIAVAETVLSHVDGVNGRLLLRGHELRDVAGTLSFEAATVLLWAGFLPKADLARLTDLFAAARERASAALPAMCAAPTGLGVYERMRLGLAALPLAGDLHPAIAIAGAQPLLLAAAARLADGKAPLPADPSLGSAADLLRMLRGTPARPEEIAALERYLVTVLDHGLNASTFAARVIASTGADLGDAVLGAMAALKGPLHGGAPGPVLDMIDAIESPEAAEAWIADELAAGRRLMGFGHRVYRTRDPRADVLKEGLALLSPDLPALRKAEAIETAAQRLLARHKPDRKLRTNVEFYTAVLLDAIGLDRRLFTPLFAVGRTPGWCAHALEQQAGGRLLRPAAIYVGPDAG
ncbi:citrate synthase [Stappia indica]|uniref:citrate synthase n=1 Tax=Stappia indica TaxID=538381 RepID=UPI001CD449E3|nr:citrate synthase [Stappia indica]MCA1298352.1 citrate synthase [Stappia indica]